MTWRATHQPLRCYDQWGLIIYYSQDIKTLLKLIVFQTRSQFTTDNGHGGNWATAEVSINCDKKPHLSAQLKLHNMQNQSDQQDYINQPTVTLLTSN